MLKVANSVINASRIATPIAFVGDVTLSTGNLVIGTSGKGIDFSITSHPAGMTSELLSDYEEGTWTPTLAASAMSDQVYASQAGTYTKVGRQVTIRGSLAMTSFTNGPGNYSRIESLPYTPASSSFIAMMYANFTGGTNGRIVIGQILTDGNIYFYEIDSDGGLNLGTGLNSNRLLQSVSFTFVGTYFV